MPRAIAIDSRSDRTLTVSRPALSCGEKIAYFLRKLWAGVATIPDFDGSTRLQLRLQLMLTH